MGSPCALPSGLAIVEPSADPVDSFEVQVVVRVPSDLHFDPTSDVRLNDVAVPVQHRGGDEYGTVLSPGFPLQRDNELELRAHRDGSTTSARRQFVYAPSTARVRRIQDASEAPGGPLADGRPGDWLIENGLVRFVVQDVAQRDLYSVGQFGGNLIDAVRADRDQLDNWIEMQPMLNVETVINAQTVDVVNDGSDGTTAILRTCGPDDLIDFINASSLITDAGLPFPAMANDTDLEIEGCTEFRLEPGASWLEIETTVFNNQSPGASPADLPLLVGDYLNPGGELETLLRPNAGMGEALLGTLDQIQYLGYGEAAGIDYAYTPVEVPSLPGERGGYVTQSGVTVVLHNADVVQSLLGVPPAFVVPQGGSLSFTRYVAVGDGTGSVASELAQAVGGQAPGILEGCVTVGGDARENSQVTILEDGASGLQVATSQRTAPGGCPNYRAVLPPGDYEVLAGRPGALYEGGAASPTLHPVSLVADERTAAPAIDLPPGGRLEVTILDEQGAPVPGRVTLVGFDPSPAQRVNGPSFPGFGSSSLALLGDPKDAPPFGVVASAYANASGFAALEVEPGSYELIVSRGTEYSMFRTPITVGSGGVQAVKAQIARVLDTEGFVSSDFHVHGIRSPDSRVSHTDRVRQFAGEGVENMIMTDHDAHTDLNPHLRDLGFRDHLRATVGEEITTFDYGHFNAYPFDVDPSLPSGGSTDFGGAAPPGQDFPSYGSFSLTPQEILDLARSQPTARPSTTAQVNHIDSHFVPLRIDTAVPGPITDDLDSPARLERRLDPGAGNLFAHFPALELWNGASRGAQSEFLDERIGIWFNHLNKGLLTTAISDTDTHTFANLRTAGARTWTASPTDAPAEIAPGDVAAAVDAGRAVGGQGIFVETRLVAADGSGRAADLRLGGSTQITSPGGDVDLEIHIQAPTWAPFDTVEIYANAATEPVDPNAPYLYRAAPGSARVLAEGDCDPGTVGDGDFDVDVVPVHPAPGAERLEATLTVPYRGLTEDTWFVVVVRGSDGRCQPMFPVFAQNLDSGSNTSLADLLDGNVGEGGVMAMGVTNALYADVDGSPGFDPPNP